MVNLTFFWLIDYNNVTLLMITCNILKPAIFILSNIIYQCNACWEIVKFQYRELTKQELRLIPTKNDNNNDNNIT